MSKKGIFFTAVAMALVAVVMLGHTLYEGFSLREQSAIESVRIRTMNSFTEDIEQDMERSLYIASFRALLGASQYISDNGVFLDDVQDRLEELVLYGTINGSFTNMTKDNYFYEWVDRVDEIADYIDVDVSFSTPIVTAYQTTPWSVTISLESHLTVDDPIQKVSWKRDNSVSTTVSILEFEDPLYTVHSSKRIVNTIRKTIFSDFVNGDVTTNLTLHAQNMYYVPSDSGPSFLMRLEGGVGSDPSGMGIESLIDVDQLTFQGYETNYSMVDYIYWGALTNVSYAINNTNFRLDNQSNHLEEYEVTGLAGP